MNGIESERGYNQNQNASTLLYAYMGEEHDVSILGDIIWNGI